MCWDVEAGLHNASVVNHLSFTRRSEFESHNVELLNLFAGFVIGHLVILPHNSMSFLFVAKQFRPN